MRRAASSSARMCSHREREVSSTCSRVRGHGWWGTATGRPMTTSRTAPRAGSEPLAPPGSRVPNIVTGTTVAPAYDSLMAKLIVHGRDRAQALQRAAQAVAGFTIVGPKSNLAFHAELLDNSEFVSGVYDTALVDRMRARPAKS